MAECWLSGKPMGEAGLVRWLHHGGILVLLPLIDSQILWHYILLLAQVFFNRSCVLCASEVIVMISLHLLSG
jgi:hypothetical protein